MRHPSEFSGSRLMSDTSGNAAIMSDNKADLRKRYLALRDEIPEPDRSRRSADIPRLISNENALKDAFHTADVVLAYFPIGSEVDTRPLIEFTLGLRKKIVFPLCIPGTKTLEWYIVEDLGDMEPGFANIPEPKRETSTRVDPSSFAEGEAIAIIPGVAFDQSGNRIGYGGGYYDRFLPRFKGRTIGLAFEEQVAENLKETGVIGDHDIAINSIIIV